MIPEKRVQIYPDCDFLGLCRYLDRLGPPLLEDIGYDQGHGRDRSSEWNDWNLLEPRDRFRDLSRD